MSEAIHYIPARPVRHEVRIKRSAFLGSLMAAVDAEAAERHIAAVRSEFHDATHNCYGYRIDENTYRYSDDGEPSGTAGKPILTMIDKYNLRQTVLVITRYFGGIKLGTGGLIRAYGQCAEETIQKGKLKKFIQYHFFRLHYPYHLTRQIEYWLEKYRGEMEEAEYGAAVEAKVKVPLRHQEAFRAELSEAGGGQIDIIDQTA